MRLAYPLYNAEVATAVFGLGGDPFPSTRTWEALAWMLEDPNTKGESAVHQVLTLLMSNAVICLVGEIGGQSERSELVTCCIP